MPKEKQFRQKERCLKRKSNAKKKDEQRERVPPKRKLIKEKESRQKERCLKRKSPAKKKAE